MNQCSKCGLTHTHQLGCSKSNLPTYAPDVESSDLRLSYRKAIDVLERELRKDYMKIDRHSVEHIMYMIPVIMLSEIYDKKLIDVASDLKRKFLKEAIMNRGDS